MRQLKLFVLVVGVALLILACGDDASDTAGDVQTVTPGPAVMRTPRTGGFGTAFDDTERAFSLTARNINHYERQAFAEGKEIFEVNWTPVGPQGFGGLGPNFDATACSSCHFDDGRAAGPAGDGVLPTGLTVKLITDDPATINEFGRGLSAFSENGDGEALVSVRYEEVAGEFDDGTPYTLRRPVYSVELYGDGSLPDDTVIGVRIAPQLPGLGLLELVPDADIIALADPDDLDGDGISGRIGAATDLLRGEPAIGRFGWNAEQPTVEQQSATAFFNDMGLTSRYFPSPDCDSWAPCVRVGQPLSTEYNVADYGDPTFGVQEPAGGEITDRQLLDLAIYTQTLAVPAARDLGDPEVERGNDLFAAVGCTSCHAGPFTTGTGPIQGLSKQVIQPYTDLLVHDMGLGLGDQMLDGTPVPTEWRTPPLWGIGLLDTVSGHTTLLHDGRARDHEEAILWHDGEAAASAAAYRALPAADRAALIRFLESL
jgi:CxxC motif-containing protein (DUF1111 family)